MRTASLAIRPVVEIELNVKSLNIAGHEGTVINKYVLE